MESLNLLLNKNDSSCPSSHCIWVATQLELKMPELPKDWQAWQTATATVNSWVHWFCHSSKTLFPHSTPMHVALRVSLFVLDSPDIFGRAGVWYKCYNWKFCNTNMLHWCGLRAALICGYRESLRRWFKIMSIQQNNSGLTSGACELLSSNGVLDKFIDGLCISSVEWALNVISHYPITLMPLLYSWACLAWFWLQFSQNTLWDENFDF